MPKLVRRRWLLVPLTMHLVAMLLPTLDRFLGWQIWHLTFAWCFDHPEPLPVLGASANVLFLLALPCVFLGRSFPRLRNAGGLMALCAFAAAVPIGGADLLEFPGYWVWTGSFAALAVVGFPLAAYRSLWTRARSPSLLVESARAGGIATPFTLLLCSVICPRVPDLAPSLFPQIVSPAIAAAGTLALVCFLAALGWRLRRSLEPWLPGLREGQATHGGEGQQRGQPVGEGEHEHHHDLVLGGLQGR